MYFFLDFFANMFIMYFYSNYICQTPCLTCYSSKESVSEDQNFAKFLFV